MAEKTYLDQDGLDLLVQNIKDYCDALGHFVFKGVASGVANLPALADATVGDVYTISSDDVTTADFMEGAGKAINANDEVVCVLNSSDVKKWAVLGPIFDVSDRLQFGSAMPTTDLTNGRTFLYMGDTTYTYTPVTPAGTEDPAALGWYHSDDGGTTWTLATEHTPDTTTYTYATRAEQYVKGVIYVYSTATSAWVPQSSGDTMVPITAAHINSLFA